MAQRKPRKGSPNLPVPNPERAAPKVDIGDRTPQDIVKILRGYWAEAEINRIGGPSSRELMWQQNVDLYWNRFDFSKKADWQAHEVMPEVPMFVDRFAAAMREALTSTDDFFVVDVPNDDESDLGNAIRKLLKVWLSRCARDALGHTLSFDAVFEELMKIGALMTCAAVVTYKGAGTKKGYIAIEPIDPRTIWLDASGRNLYRIRRYSIDKTQLMELARLEDSAGNPIYDMNELERLGAELALKQEWERARLTGVGQMETSNRESIIIDEYLCTLIAPDGEQIAENVLCVVANERFLIRGPEPNPFWHEGDWLVSAPLVTAPLSPYGRAYIENLGTIARTFNELTNLILDATFTSAMKAFAAAPENLEDPTQLDEGIWPNKLFKLADGVKATEFMAEVNLGALPGQAVEVWQVLKQELQEAAAFSDISLGQFAPKGRTSASEVQSVQNNSTSLMKSLAKTVEQRILEPLLTLVWKTGLQHMPKHDPVVEQIVGEQMYAMLYAKRKEFVEAPITFRVRGISALVSRMQKLQALLNMLQVIAQNQELAQAFLQKVDPGRLIDELFKLYDVDPTELEPTQRELLMRELQQKIAQVAAQAAQPQPALPPGGPPPGAGPGGPPVPLRPLPTPNPVQATAAATPIANAAPMMR